MGLLLLQAPTGEHPEMPTDLPSWAAAVAIIVALLTLASFLGGYFALRKQVEKIDDRLKEVTKALPDLARNTELQKLSTDIQDLRLANERLASKVQMEDVIREGRSSVQGIMLATQQLTGILTIVTKGQAEISELRRDVDKLKTKIQGA